MHAPSKGEAVASWFVQDHWVEVAKHLIPISSGKLTWKECGSRETKLSEHTVPSYHFRTDPIELKGRNPCKTSFDALWLSYLPVGRNEGDPAGSPLRGPAWLVRRSVGAVHQVLLNSRLQLPERRQSRRRLEGGANTDSNAQERRKRSLEGFLPRLAALLDERPTEPLPGAYAVLTEQFVSIDHVPDSVAAPNAWVDAKALALLQNHLRIPSPPFLASEIQTCPVQVSRDWEQWIRSVGGLLLQGAYFDCAPRTDAFELIRTTCPGGTDQLGKYFQSLLGKDVDGFVTAVEKFLRSPNISPTNRLVVLSTFARLKPEYALAHILEHLDDPVIGNRVARLAWQHRVTLLPTEQEGEHRTSPRNTVAAALLEDPDLKESARSELRASLRRFKPFDLTGVKRLGVVTASSFALGFALHRTYVPLHRVSPEGTPDARVAANDLHSIELQLEVGEVFHRHPLSVYGAYIKGLPEPLTVPLRNTLDLSEAALPTISVDPARDHWETLGTLIRKLHEPPPSSPSLAPRFVPGTPQLVATSGGELERLEARHNGATPVAMVEGLWFPVRRIEGGIRSELDVVIAPSGTKTHFTKFSAPYSVPTDDVPQIFHSVTRESDTVHARLRLKYSDPRLEHFVRRSLAYDGQVLVVPDQFSQVTVECCIQAKNGRLIPLTSTTVSRAELDHPYILSVDAQFKPANFERFIHEYRSARTYLRVTINYESDQGALRSERVVPTTYTADRLELAFQRLGIREAPQLEISVPGRNLSELRDRYFAERDALYHTVTALADRVRSVTAANAMSWTRPDALLERIRWKMLEHGIQHLERDWIKDEVPIPSSIAESALSAKWRRDYLAFGGDPEPVLAVEADLYQATTTKVRYPDLSPWTVPQVEQVPTSVRTLEGDALMKDLRKLEFLRLLFQSQTVQKAVQTEPATCALYEQAEQEAAALINSARDWMISTYQTHLFTRYYDY